MRCDSPPESVGVGRLRSDNPGRRRPGIAGDCAISRSNSPATCCWSVRQLEVLETTPTSRCSGSSHKLADRAVLETAGGRVVAQPRAAAGGAGHLADQLVELVAIDKADARRPRRGPASSPCTETASRACRRLASSRRLRIRLAIESRRRPCRADQPLLRRIELLERRVQREAAVVGQCLGEACEQGIVRQAPATPAIAPARSDKPAHRGSARPGWRPAATPSPSQVGHQPSGLLNEK